MLTIFNPATKKDGKGIDEQGGGTRTRVRGDEQGCVVRNEGAW